MFANGGGGIHSTLRPDDASKLRNVERSRRKSCHNKETWSTFDSISTIAAAESAKYSWKALLLSLTASLSRITLPFQRPDDNESSICMQRFLTYAEPWTLQDWQNEICF